MPLTFASSIPRGAIIGQPLVTITEEEIEDMFVPASANNVSPFGTIGVVAEHIPDLFSAWNNHNLPAWGDGGVEGMSATFPIQQWQGKTIEVFFIFGHTHPTATGDIRVQLDVGPRAAKEVEGAPNDAASFRTLSTLTVNAGAGLEQDVFNYVSVGTFDVGASDIAALFEFKRLGTDGADNFAGSIGAVGCHLRVQ